MKRRWNFLIWAGFVLVVIGLMSYVPFFALFPITRDFPWVNLLLFGGGAVLLGAGLRRAFKQPELYRGKTLGSLLGALSVAGAQTSGGSTGSPAPGVADWAKSPGIVDGPTVATIPAARGVRLS